MLRALYLILVVFSLSAGSLAAEESAEHSGHHAIPHHWVAGVAGYALERKREKDEETLAIGVEYGYRFSQKWGIGAVFETLGEDVVRDTALVAPVSFHPGAGWRLFAGPGVEFTDKHNDWMFRWGAGYEFELTDNWTLAPEFVYDVIESGKRTYVLALALGYAF